MDKIAQNTLYLTTPASYVARDHLTLRVEVPVYPAGLPPEERTRDKAADWRRLSIPIHHLESICVFGASTLSPPALDLCWAHGVAVNYLSESGYLQARLTGVADTSVVLRRTQFRAADDPGKCAALARQIIATMAPDLGPIMFRQMCRPCAADHRRQTSEQPQQSPARRERIGKCRSQSTNHRGHRRARAPDSSARAI